MPWPGSSWSAPAAGTPLLPGAGVLAFIDMDSTQKRVYGHKKEGARFGHTKIQGKSRAIRGLNALIAAVISTPLAAPVIAATRLRGGNGDLGPRRRVARRRSDRHRPPGRVHRDQRSSGSTRPYYSAAVLERDPAQRGALLGHRADGPRDPRRDHRHPARQRGTPITYPRAIWDDRTSTG